MVVKEQGMADRTKEMIESIDDKGLVRIFVYGTLKKDHGNHGLLLESDAVFLGYDSITGAYKMCDMVGFPGVYRPQPAPTNHTTIRGELWAMKPEGLATLDMLEGHPNFYRREKFWTNNEKRAWMYLLSPRYVGQMKVLTTEKKSIPEGIWRPSDAENTHWETIND